MLIQLCRKSAHFAQKSRSIKKLPISKVESFVKSNFDIHQKYKIALIQDHNNLNLNDTD